MKAFKKGEVAVYVRADGDCSFTFRRVEVMSCGNRKMTLKDVATGEMLGSDFFPGIGFGSHMCNPNSLNLPEGRPVHHMIRNGTFKDMSDEDCMKFCLTLSEQFMAWELKVLEQGMKEDLERYGKETGWYKTTAATVERIKTKGPTASKR